MKSDFMLAINQLCTERKLSREVVLEAVEAALISAYKRNFGSATNIEARVDPNTGDVRVFAIKEVVETVQDEKIQISLAEAGHVSPEAELGADVMIESTPRDFGRIAAQTAKQVILQRIREAEREVLFSTFVDKTGDIALGTVQSVEYHSGNAIVNVDGAEALLPAREQVPGERYRRGVRLRAYVMDVRRGNRGPQITLSRRTPALLSRLLELEVPEVFSGAVEIKAIAREAGSRSKVAVHATQDGVDPVGSCVGVRGGRIQSVVNELGGEKIDVVQWDPNVGAFIGNALSPAKVMNVLLDDDPNAGKTATVIVPDRQLSLAIGKEGQNARLAAKLTGWRIDIKSATETAEETLGRFVEPEIAPEEMDLLALAESLLRGRDSEEFSETERSLIDAELGRSGDADLPWPAVPGEPIPARIPSADAEPATELGASPESVDVEAALAAEPHAPADLGEEPGASVAGTRPAEVVTEGEEAGDASETVPSFEGEQLEDSLGWVATEPPEEFQYDWDEAVPTEGDRGWQSEWGSEKKEEPEELAKQKAAMTRRTKKRRKRGRQTSDSQADNQDRGGRGWRS